MLHIGTVLLWGVAALLGYYIVSAIATRIRNARKSRQLGCAPMPTVPVPIWDSAGITLVRANFAAAKEQKFHEFLVRRHGWAAQGAGFEAETYSFNVLGRPLVFTADPENIKAILALQFKDFHLPPTRKGTFDDLLGTGIFTSDGRAWEHSRALLRPNFAREQVSNLDLEERHNQHLLRAIALSKPAASEKGWTDFVDLNPLFFRLTLDTSTEFLFGESVNTQLAALSGKRLTADEAQREHFGEAFDNAQFFIARRARLGTRWWMMRSKQHDRDCAACHSFIDQYVRLALEQDVRPKTDPEKAPNGNKYVFLNELAQQTRDPIELRSQLLHILLAGRDTTASLLGWVFLLLARHPAVFAKLRQAIIDDFGAGPTANPSQISFAKLKNCTYLQCVLSETLRLYPVVPANSRYAVTDTTLPRGGGPDGQSPVFIPKGTDLNYSVYVMQRNKTLWGADADEFKPERFIKRKHGYEFLPFNGGPRICLGQNFALTSAGYATVRLLQTYDAIEGMPGTHTSIGGIEPRSRVALTMKPGDMCSVRLREAV